MALKLFRSTGYASVFGPGETRIALHPGWVVLALSLWAGLACNAPLWLTLLGRGQPQQALAFALLAGGITAVLLGLLGWGHFFKPAAMLLLWAAAWLAAVAWSRGATGAPVWLPWSLVLTLPVLGLLPWVWLRNVPVKRMSMPRQLRCNLLAVLLGAAACAASLSLAAPMLARAGA